MPPLVLALAVVADKAVAVAVVVSMVQCLQVVVAVEEAVLPHLLLLLVLPVVMMHLVQPAVMMRLVVVGLVVHQLPETLLLLQMSYR